MVTFGHLPANAQAKLELPWIKRRSRLAGFSVKRIHVCHVEAVNKVEHIHHALQLHALIDAEAAGNAHIGKDRHWPYAGVAAQVSIE